MRLQLHDRLEQASSNGALPAVLAYHRIDGPGSSLDLREFQQSMWSVANAQQDESDDAAVAWTNGLPRTVGITISTGTRVEAHPFDPDRIAVRSVDYNTEVIGSPGAVPPSKENWLLKILDILGLSGVMFILQNLQSDTQSAGLGGSATATTGVCILANELAGRPLSLTQLVSMASRLEQDLGVSITGTQEQSNVAFGGVCDYVWCPWGVPGRPETGYGESLRAQLLPPEDYGEVERRMTIFHTGQARASTDVNSVWCDKLQTVEGYKLHSKKLALAYQFREGLRLRQWDQVVDAVGQYRAVRTELCADYMAGADEMHRCAEANGGAVFPLGAGGGGGVLVVATEPESFQTIREEVGKNHTEITVKIRAKGHDLVNLPLES